MDEDFSIHQRSARPSLFNLASQMNLLLNLNIFNKERNVVADACAEKKSL